MYKNKYPIFDKKTIRFLLNLKNKKTQIPNNLAFNYRISYQKLELQIKEKLKALKH